MPISNEKTVLRKPSGKATEAIIGDDERNQVDPSRLHWDPYTGIVRMEMDFTSGRSIGTAWLVSERVALTAAHNFVNGGGETASRVVLQQAHSGAQVFAAAFFVNERYRAHQTEADDYALVELDRPFQDAAHIGLDFWPGQIALIEEFDQTCRDCHFGIELTGCSDCFACISLQHKRFHFFKIH